MTGTGDVIPMPVVQPEPMPEPAPDPVPDPAPEPVSSPQPSNDPGSPAVPAGKQAREDAARHPLVKAVMDTFPGATIEEVREGGAAMPEGMEDEPQDDSEPDVD